MKFKLRGALCGAQLPCHKGWRSSGRERATASRRLYSFLLAGDHCPPSILHFDTRLSRNIKEISPKKEEEMQDNVLVVLKHDFNECPVVGAQDGCILVKSTASGIIRYASHAENSLNLEVVSKLERSISWHEGHAVDSVSLIVMQKISRVCKPNRPRVDLNGRSTGRGAGDLEIRVAVVKNCGGGKDCLGETARDCNVVVLGRLISSNEDGVGLTDMNIKRGESSLHGVRSLYFHQCHRVTLDPKIERIFQPDIGDS
nr:hypothetical protein Iba_chr06eCG10870 [Ipomoea batatas]